MSFHICISGDNVCNFKLTLEHTQGENDVVFTDILPNNHRFARSVVITQPYW